MTFMPGLGDIIQQVAELAANGDLVKDPDKIAELKRTLTRNAGLLEDGEFRNVELATNAFGSSAEAEDLGRHHALAHTIVADTILGVVDDLLGFRDGVEVFERHVDQADGDTAADLQQRQQGVAALVAASTYSQGDRNNRDSRSENLPPNGTED